MSVNAPGGASPATATGLAATVAPRSPSDDLRLARLHLRLGMLPAARAELEDLAGRNLLDVDGWAALAEARWRSGGLAEAAEAAEAHLAANGRDPVAVVIAAEAAAADGRPDDAHDRMGRLAGLDAATLDALFAGMPRRAHWPLAASQVSGEAGGGSGATSTSGASGGTSTGGSPAPIRSSAVPTPADVLAATAQLFEGAAAASTPGAPMSGRQPAPVAAAAPTWVEPARARGHADPEAELDTAEAELGTAPERAFLRFALVLRLDPTLASDVLAAIRLRREPEAAVIRGDAQRLLGRHLEAEAAFADAIELIEREALATGHHHQPGVNPPPGQEVS